MATTNNAALRKKTPFHVSILAKQTTRPMSFGGAPLVRDWRRAPIIACVLSVALHLALLVGLQVEMPEKKTPAIRILEARLVPLKPAAPMIEPVIEPAPPALEIVKPKPRPRRPTTVAPKPITAPLPPPADPVPEAPPAPSTDAPVPEVAPVAPLASEPAPAEKPRSVSMPKRILIRFAVNWGTDGPGVGKAEYRWLRDGNRYELQSITESTGVIALFTAQKLQQTSTGEITERGLQPEIFVIQRGTKRSDSALFDWNEKSLKLVDSEKIQTLPLPAGTQDIMSLLFQFAFAPPAQGDIAFSVVTGRKLETYRFTVLGEEILRMPGGRVRALHISRPKTETDDGMDVWLDQNRFFLPVKIRSEQRRDSRPIELVAAEILVPPEEQ